MDFKWFQKWSKMVKKLFCFLQWRIWTWNPDGWAKHVKTNFWRPRFCLTGGGAVVTLYVTIYMIACDVVVQCSLNWRPWGWGLRCSRIRRRPITIAAATLKFETVVKNQVIPTFSTYHSVLFAGYVVTSLSDITQCLKITEKVSFNIASKASYVYIHSFWKAEACSQIVFPDRKDF